MRRETVGLLVALGGALAFGNANGDDRCLHEVDRILFGAKDWSELRTWRQEFPECDDGYLADGVSEFVTASLSKRWGDVPSLQVVVAREPEFEGFVLRHIDATADSGNLKAVVNNATKRCPDGAAPLCTAMANAARSALAEQAKVRSNSDDTK
jgi:hypothetical protein